MVDSSVGVVKLIASTGHTMCHTLTEDGDGYGLGDDGHGGYTLVPL